MEELTANQLVALNLRLARHLRGWTQAEAAEKLEPFLGVLWSRASFSVAEHSIDGKRIRHFSADEILAFALAFELPISWFLLPPGGEDAQVRSSEASLDTLAVLRLLFPSDVDAIWESLATLRTWGPGDARWKEIQLIVRDHLLGLLSKLGYEASQVTDLEVMVARLQQQVAAERAIYEMTGERRPETVETEEADGTADQSPDEEEER